MNRSASVDSVILYNAKNVINVNNTVISSNTVRNFIYAGSSSTGTKLEYCNIQDNHLSESNFTANTGSVSISKNYWGSNDEPSLSDATPYVIYESGIYKLSDDSETNIEIPSLTEEPETITYTIYVDPINGDNDKDGSSQSSAVKTISKAVEIVNNGKIILLGGIHNISSTITLTQNLDFTGKTGAIISGDVQMFNNPEFELNFTNIKFINSATSGNIIINKGILNIEKCIFEVITSDNTINAEDGIINIANSILLNSNGQFIGNSTPAVVTANNNWWGVNSKPNDIAENWIVMNATIDLERINPNDEVTITVSFNKTNDGSDYTGTLPEFNVTVTASNLNQNLTVKNNKASVIYAVEADDEVSITSGSESVKLPLKLYVAPEIIYVNATGDDKNDGDEVHPVKSIAQAIALAQKGKIIILEGNYTLDNTLNISKDLDIAGVGKVIVNGSGKRFFLNTANLNITNIEFTNGIDNGGAFLNNANLTLTNVSIYSSVNSVGSGASVIRNNKKLTVFNSKFYDNEAVRGNIHNEKGEVTIINCEFYNNKFTKEENAATGYGIYNYQGNVTVENTIFRQNDGLAPLIYSYTDPNRLTIINCTFEDNNMSRFGAVVAQDTVAQIINSTFKNNRADKTSTQTGEGGAVYISNGNVTVENSQFINNKADSGKDIYVNSGELNIFQSILINENGYSIEKGTSAVVTANDNWWGANTPNTQINVERWIIMTVTCNDSDIRAGDEINITVSFDKTNSSQGIAEYTGNLGDLNVTLAPSTTKTTANKIAEFTYTVGDNDKNITITSSNATEVLKVRKVLDVIYVAVDGNDTNDGDY